MRLSLHGEAPSFSLQNIKLEAAKPDATPPSQKKEIGIDVSLSWTRTPRRVGFLFLPHRWKDEGLANDVLLATGWGNSNPEPSVDNFKQTSFKVCFCEFKLLLSFHESTKYTFFPSWLLFILTDPVKEPGAGYILEVRKGNHSHQKGEL